MLGTFNPAMRNRERAADDHLIFDVRRLLDQDPFLGLQACDARFRGKVQLAGDFLQRPCLRVTVEPWLPIAADEPQIDPEPADGKTPSGGPPWDAAATEVCETVVGGGFSQVAQSPDDAGTTTFWTNGRRWVACDVAAGADGVEPAVLSSTRRGSSGFVERSLAVTTTVLPGPDGSPAAVRLVAGGRLPWRVDEISYTFPDGHTEQATFVTSEGAPEEVWWSVAYTPTEGVLVDPETEPADLDPVTISIVGAAAEAFRLPWQDLQRSE